MLREALRAGRSRAAGWVQRPRRRRLLAAALEAGLPATLERPLRFLIDGQLDDHDTGRCDRVEELRSQLASRPGTVEIYYSPKPGSAGAVPTAEMRPDHGEVQQFDLERVARETSVGRREGRFMYLTARASGAETILELGACAGIASAYLASSGCQRFIGVEGARDLANIARFNVQAVKPDAEIIHATFDEALDRLLPIGDGLDTVWIDGHHEKVATLHYLQRLQPSLSDGACVFFDDIRWSQDMHDAWRVIQETKGFAHTVDLGRIGLGVWGDGSGSPRTWDLTGITGRPSIGTPVGWG